MTQQQFDELKSLISRNFEMIDRIYEEHGGRLTRLEVVQEQFSHDLHAVAEGVEVTTSEGVATNGALHPMQAACKEHHGLQCGFCTPGMVLSGMDLVSRKPDPSEGDVREWLEGNLCRCTGYHNIVKAVQAAASEMGG